MCEYICMCVYVCNREREKKRGVPSLPQSLAHAIRRSSTKRHLGSCSPAKMVWTSLTLLTLPTCSALRRWYSPHPPAPWGGGAQGRWWAVGNPMWDSGVGPRPSGSTETG